MNNWRRILIPKDASIGDAIRVLEESAQGVAIVCGPELQLLGLITDGDVRRAMLSGRGTGEAASAIMTRKPLTVPAGTSVQFIRELMKTNVIAHVPILDSNGILLGVEILPELLSNQYSDYPVVLMAGGLGSRLGELTKSCPKPLLKINKKPILEIMIERLRAHGFSNLFISVNYKADMVEQHFGDGSDFGVSIKYLKEPKRLGTAGALSLLPPQSSPVLVMNGDLMTEVNFSKLVEFHELRAFDATVGLFRHEVEIPFGVVELNPEGTIRAFKEKPKKSYLVNAGIYVLNPSVMSLIPENDFFDMNSLFQTAFSNGLSAGGFPIHEYWIDIGRVQDLELARSKAEQC